MTRSDIPIRIATYNDVEALRLYAERLFAEKLPGLFDRPTPTPEEELEFVRRHLEPANSTLILADDDGVVAGLLEVVGGGLPQEAHVGTLGVSVDRDYRGSGLGTALFEAVFTWAAEHGLTRLQLYAFSNNPRAAELYRRLGFEDEGRLREAVMVDGEPVDVLVLARLLPARS